MLVQSLEHTRAVSPAHELEPPIVAMLRKRINFAVDTAMRPLSANENVPIAKARSPKSVG